MKSRLVRVQSVGALVLFIACSPLTTHAITVGVQAASGDPGSPVEVQVYLTGGNGLVAGVQTLIAWDSTCLSPVRGTGRSGNPAECSSNPAIPKTLSTNIKSPSNLLALFLSYSDVEPIAQDTWLFTCIFTIDAATTATQCPVTLPSVILSDSKGGRLPGDGGEWRSADPSVTDPDRNRGATRVGRKRRPRAGRASRRRGVRDRPAAAGWLCAAVALNHSRAGPTAPGVSQWRLIPSSAARIASRVRGPR